nr:MAG TPA: hypothetical protein [Caudoviricetes sp.]
MKFRFKIISLSTATGTIFLTCGFSCNQSTAHFAF